MNLTDRMPGIPVDQMTAAQKKAHDEIASGPRGALYGPFVPLLRSPEFMSRLQKAGEYLRYGNVLPKKISEFVILLTARQWTQEVEWHLHYPIALKLGLKPEIAAAIAEGRRPEGMSQDEEIVHEFCSELRQNQGVSDKTFQRALARFGEQGIIDLVGLIGYYTLMAMVMNVARTALPEGHGPGLAP